MYFSVFYGKTTVFAAKPPPTQCRKLQFIGLSVTANLPIDYHVIARAVRPVAISRYSLDCPECSRPIGFLTFTHCLCGGVVIERLSQEIATSATPPHNDTPLGLCLPNKMKFEKTSAPGGADGGDHSSVSEISASAASSAVSSALGGLTKAINSSPVMVSLLSR